MRCETQVIINSLEWYRGNELLWHETSRNSLILYYFMGVIFSLAEQFFSNPGKHLIVFLNMLMTEYRTKLVLNEKKCDL